MKRTLSQILTVILVFAAACSYAGSGFSYVYIQGDKSVPFYVKLEDQMLPRYGKNYNLIPQLAPGPINVQILFQQNAYPAQKFTIVVPENGFRGFLLLKRGDVFTLYDIQQQFYLHPGNKAADDRAPANNTFVATNAVEKAPASTSTIATGRRDQTELKFLPDVVLNNERTLQQEPANEWQEEATPTVQEPTPQRTTVGNRMPIANSDCPAPMSDQDFEDMYSKVSSKAEKVKLKFLLSNMEACYSTNQARILAEALGNDPERYTFLKRVFSRITDQHNFAQLESLLSTQEWKSYFRLILPK